MTNILFDALLAPHQGSTRTFLVPQRGDPLSYGGFSISARYANLFVSLGVEKGDRIAIQAPKSPEALAVYAAACLRAGAALLPLNPAYTADELDYFIGDAEPRLLITGASPPPAVSAVASRHGVTMLTIAAGGAGSLGTRAAAHPADHAVCPCAAGDLAAILYTSGTTGRSKGAMLSHGNLLSNARALVDLWRFTADDVLLHALPIFHTHGLFVATNCCLLSGASMLFHEAFAAEAVIAALPGATVLMGVPTFYTRMLQSPALDREVVRHVRLFVSGSAPLLAETHRAFEDRTGQRILERYGMTETNMNSSNPYVGQRKPGTVGPPLPGVDIVITDAATGVPVAPGGIGMIEVRGPNVFSGYWRMPDKTAAELRPSGFFITGDLGQFDADGYLAIVGRQKDLIISGGYNIYPKEIELLIDAVEGVAESAVFGVADADFGEAVIAAVVAAPGASVTAEGIAADLALRLARFKQPRRIILMDDLPRNAMGKVQKNLLRDRHAPAETPTQS